MTTTMTTTTALPPTNVASKVDFATYLGDKRIERDSDAMLSYETDSDRRAPVSYHDLSNIVLDKIAESGYSVIQSSHATTNNNALYFGIAELATSSDKAVPIIGWRASKNQRVSATLYLGAGLPQQNILCMSNEVKICSRQTAHLRERLPEMVQEGLSRVASTERQQQQLFTRLRNFRIKDSEAEAAIIDMIRHDIISPSKAGIVIGEWDMPSSQFLRGSRNLWRLFHAVSESYKPVGTTDAISTLLDRTPNLLAYMKAMVLDRI